MARALRERVKAITATYIVTDIDEVVLADATGGAIVVTLPTAVGIKGRRLLVKKTDSTKLGVTIDGYSTETLDGDSTIVLGLQGALVDLESDGTNWVIRGGWGFLFVSRYAGVAQSITAVGNTLGVSRSLLYASPTSDLTLTSTPTIETTNVPAGTVLKIINPYSSGFTLTVQDESGLSGSKLRNLGATTKALAPGSATSWIFGGTYWHLER